MTDDRTALIELVEKQADGDLLREMPAFAAERIMEAEVEARTGAAKGARTPMREVQRNGYRDRDWDTRAGRIALEIPKLRKGGWALLHKSGDGQGSPFPGQTYPTASVTGMPSAVKPLSTATRTWNSAT